MSLTVGVLGIIVALVVLNFLIYKGLNVVLADVITAFIIMLTSGLPILETWKTAMGSVGGVMGTLIPIIIFGSIMGIVYTKSGAAVSLAEFLMIPVRKAKTVNGKRVGTILMFLVLRLIIGLAGIDSMAIMYTMLAIAASMFAECDLPRKYVNAIMMIGGTIPVFIPGVPGQVQVLYGTLIGFDNMSNAVVRMLTAVLFVAGCVFILNRNMAKDQATGAHFEAGPLQFPEVGSKKPHWLAAVVPILAVYISYNILKIDAWAAMLIGIVFAVILFGAYLPVAEGKNRLVTVVETLNSGVFLVPVAILMNMLPGFVMQASPAYEYLVSLVTNLPIPSAFGLLVIATIIVGVASNGAPILLAGIITNVFVPGGMSVSACVVIALAASTILDTLPNSLGIITQCEIIQIPMKEAYPPIFKTTVLWTAVIAVLVALAAMIGIAA